MTNKLYKNYKPPTTKGFTVCGWHNHMFAMCNTPCVPVLVHAFVDMYNTRNILLCKTDLDFFVLCHAGFCIKHYVKIITMNFCARRLICVLIGFTWQNRNKVSYHLQRMLQIPNTKWPNALYITCEEKFLQKPLLVMG